MEMFEVVARVAARGGTVAVLGGIDTGKSTFCSMTAEAALRLGKRVAYLDADVATPTIGPPATIGLKFIHSVEDLLPGSLNVPDELYFVGSTSARGHMLPMAVGTAKLARSALAAGVDLLVIDTSGWIGGTQGQVLKLHKLEAIAPDWIVGFQRGEELEPILGVLRRTLPADVESIPVDPSIRLTTIDDRAEQRRVSLERAFAPPLHRWRVRPSILVPALPPDVEPAALHRLLVGLDDGKGGCMGLGILEHYKDTLRLVTAVEESPRALRLGSLRVAQDHSSRAVDLRDLFLTD